MPSTSDGGSAGIRRAGPADAAAVRDLTHAAYAKWVPVLGRAPKPMTVDYDWAVVEHRIDVIEDADRPLALLETVVRSDDLLVENLAVAPAHQGRGLGRRLLAHADVLARAAGRGAVRLYTNQRMAGNVALYERHGYRIEFHVQNERGTIVHMVKRLDGGS